MAASGLDSFTDAPETRSRRARSSEPAMPERLERRRRDGRSGTRGKKRMTKRKKIVLGVVIAVAVLALAAGAYTFFLMRNADKNMALDAKEREKLNAALVAADENKPYYILVVGSDTRVTGQAARSDTIMLCRMDPPNKRASILSIPRDTRIELPGHGTAKINAALAYGGPSGAVKAVSDFAGVPIAHYVEIDFEGFKSIVDSLGGVTVKVPAAASYQGVSIQPGTQTLDGTHALVFVRARKSYALGDFQRAANQRVFLKAVAKKVLKAPPTKIPGLLTSMSKCVGSDLSSTQMVSMAMKFRSMNTDTDIYSGQVPSKTANINGVSYVLPIESQWSDVRTKFTTGVVPFVTKENQPAVKE